MNGLKKTKQSLKKYGNPCGIPTIKTAMRSSPGKIPRIIKILEVNNFRVSCAFNTGEYRIIDFENLFTQWGINENHFAFSITDPKIFKTVKLVNNTLSWPQISKKIKLSNGMEFDAPYEVDPIVLFENSIPDEKRNKSYNIGHLIRQARKQEGLTQDELAQKSGTSKTYISRIENDRSDIELGTLRKIVEIGLGKKLDLIIEGAEE